MHEEEVVPNPSVEWTRRSYTKKCGSNPDYVESAELETDRDLDKPVEQLLCDIHEAHQEWIHRRRSEPTTENRAIELVLYSMTRTNSMMARVALTDEKLAQENIKLQRSVTCLTKVIVVLTIVMVGLMIVQLTKT